MPLSARRIMNLICSSRLMCSMLIVTLKDALLFDFLLMFYLYRVDIIGSCTSEDVVELIEVLDLAVVVLRVPVGFEEGAPVGCGAIIHGL